MSRGEMYLGQIVAAMYTDGLFYRARIVGTHQKEIQVFYIDYGSSGVVNIDRLRHLHIAFTRLPVQAFLGRVFGIQPYPDQSKWSLESGKVFLNMVKGKLSLFTDFKYLLHYCFLKREQDNGSCENERGNKNVRGNAN